jgi:hypothetical protein
MLGSSLIEPVGAEEYAPVTTADLVEHGVDQHTPVGVCTRLRESVEFSHMPSTFLRPTSWPNASPDTSGWLEPNGNLPAQPPHVPSQMARDGRIRNLVSSYGIEDRMDGGGGFSLASKEMMEYIAAQRNV